MNIKSFIKIKDIIIILSISTILILIVLVNLYSLGSLKYFNTKINFHISDENNFPVHLAQICLDDLCKRTDENGRISVSTSSGRYTIKIVQEGFKLFEQQIFISPLDNQLHFVVQSDTIRSKTINFNDNYNFQDIKFRDQERVLPFKIVDENIIEVYQILNSTNTIKLHSPHYNDVILSNFDNIELEEAVDIFISAQDWLSQEIIDQFSVTWDQDTYLSSGKPVVLKDIPIKTIQITIKSVGYNPRTINLEVDNIGTLDELLFQVSEADKIYYVQVIEGSKKIVESNIDGSDPRIISNHPGESFGICNSDESLYYLTTKDNASTKFGFNIPLLYKYSRESGDTIKISKTNYPKFENIGEYNCMSERRLFNLKGTIYLGNIDGTESAEIISLGDNIELIDYKISNNRKLISYLYKIEDKYTLEIFNLEDNSETELFKNSYPITLEGFTNDSEFLKVQTFEDNQSIYKLFSLETYEKSFEFPININKTQSILIDKNNEEFILFIDKQNGQSNLYTYSRNSNQINQITEDENISWIKLDHSENYLLIGKGSELFVAKVDDVSVYKKVTDNVSNPYRFDNYFYL